MKSQECLQLELLGSGPAEAHSGGEASSEVL
jgi:hypothetical protein